MRICTSRLFIREYIENDLPSILKMNAPDAITQYIRGGKKLTYKEEQELLSKRIAAYSNKNGLGVWAICLKDSDQLIGSINLNSLTTDDNHNGKVHLGFRIAVPHWKNGYAYEASKAIVNYAKNELQLQEISAFSDPDNLASQNVLKKIGFEKIASTEIYNFPGIEFKLELDNFLR